jgi:hypothetical protein
VGQLLHVLVLRVLAFRCVWGNNHDMMLPTEWRIAEKWNNSPYSRGWRTLTVWGNGFAALTPLVCYCCQQDKEPLTMRRFIAWCERAFVVH